MSDLLEPTPGFVFGSFLFNSEKTNETLCSDLWSKNYDISDTFIPLFNPLRDYYAKEMGEHLKRFFVIDFKPRPRSEFVAAKLWADDLERKYMVDGKRIINLDIGFLSLENFQLATGKPYSHRVYLSNGIYSDLTYIFEAGSFKSLPWTYPDYRDDEKIKIFNSWRAKLKEMQ